MLKKLFAVVAVLGLGLFGMISNTFAYTGFTDTLTTVAQGWVDEVPVIMATPVGWFIYLVLGLVVLFTAVGLVMWIIMWGKKVMGQKKWRRGR